MRTRSANHVPAHLIVLATVWGAAAYIFIIGIQRFIMESWGTLIISPGIYVRLLPEPLGQGLLYSLVKYPILNSFLCAVPLLFIGYAIILALWALWDGSVLKAGVSFWIVVTIFALYHNLQPFGLSYMAFN